MAVVLVAILPVCEGNGQVTQAEMQERKPAVAAESPPESKETDKKPAFQVGKEWRRLAEEHELWVNVKEKKVLLGGYVCLRAGQLEMFACPIHTKEHESVVAVKSPARFVHAALLAIGAKEGKPVQYEPEYKSAKGLEVAVEVRWKTKDGTSKKCPAQQWIKRVKTGKALAYSWVFVGSSFWQDEPTGPRYYSADAGEFICVSNFPTAMMDLPVKSSDANEQLMFEAFTKNIPPRGTPVQLVLTPKLPEKKKGASSTAEKTEPKKSSE